MSLTYGFSKAATKNENGLCPPSEEIATLIQRFIKEKRYIANLSECTLGIFKDVFKRWERYGGGGIPNKESLNQFVVTMREQGLAISTVNITIRSFNSFLSWLKENDYIKEPL